MRTLILLLTIAVLLSLTHVAHADPGDIEARGYKPLGPDLTAEAGAGFAVEVWRVPSSWPLFPDRIVFLDGLTIRGQYALGGSISRRRAEEDDRLRLWAAGWREKQFEWSWGIAYGYPIDWSW